MQVLMEVDKSWLIRQLDKAGVQNIAFLAGQKFNVGNVILAVEQRGIEVPEIFFVELAAAMQLPYMVKEYVESNSALAAALPYSMLADNLAVPLEMSDGHITLATANPLNTDFFRELEKTVHAEVELCVTSIDAVKQTLANGYESIHKYRALRDLRYRRPHESAYKVLYPWQKVGILASIISILVLFVINYPLSFVVLFAAINLAYFSINPVKFYISMRGFAGSRRSIRVSDTDVKNVDEARLPIYTILIPIFHEAQVLSHIVENVYKLDYPRERLDVKILMEEKDEETIREAQRLGLFGKPETLIPTIMNSEMTRPPLPLNLVSCKKVVDANADVIGTVENITSSDGHTQLLTVKREGGETILIPERFIQSAKDVVRLTDGLDEIIAQYQESLKIFDPVVVPDAEIKTKPRACNFGLLRAKGEYCVIFDAEDDPEPDQLKKAAIAFSRAPDDVVCLQSRLNFYNPKDNLLTRWFSLEYSFWYDYYLDGLDKVGAPLPLGGTSNHFRTKQLRDVGGWDPYNMTEDADLGVRISRRGLKTAMLNSYTYEEANKRVPSWIRQRSRWCKGHFQTYLVHMRNPRKLLKDLGWKQFLYFQLTFGGNIFLPLINPVLWGVTALTLLWPGVFNFLFFYPITYICIFNLIVGNGVYMMLHMGPYVIKKHYTSLPLAILIPIYWVLISIGDWRGTIQLFTKPFYWEKTEHGLSHLHAK